MNEVKRYDIVGDMDGNCNLNEARMELSDDGVYVKHRDYEALQAKCAELAAENELAMESMRKADAAVKLAHEKFLSMDDDIQKLRNAYSNEPMAWIHYDNGLGIPAITRSKNIADDWIARGWNVINLHAKLTSESDVENDVDSSYDTTAQQFESLSNHKHHFINGNCVECLKSE